MDGPDVVCKVTLDGRVSNNKGLSLPGMNVSVPALSGKDISDLEFALRLGVDLVALSFVWSPLDLGLVHEVMDRIGRRTPVIAKLEKPEAVDDLEAVVDAFDGIMVARGDLGVELPLERVPMVQKRAVQLCRERQAGHRRHPDARLHDRQSASHPGRGLRRGKRRPRRSRRGHALRRDQRRVLPPRDRADHGSGHRGG